MVNRQGRQYAWRVTTAQLLQNVLPKFVGELRARLGTSLIEARLFGSYARGTAHEHSDVDVFVLVDELTQARYREVLDVAWEIGFAHDLLIRPTVFDRARFVRWRNQQRPLVMDIERDGVALDG